MAGDQTLTRLNGIISCVMAVLVCVAVGAMGFLYVPAAFSYVREATTFKPAEPIQFSYEPVTLNYDPSQWQHQPYIDVEALMGNGANRSRNNNERAMRDYRP